MGELTKGKGTYGNVIRKGISNTVTIGMYCSLGDNIKVDSGFNHNIKLITTYPFNHLWGRPDLNHLHPINLGDITIGNDVWIGDDVTIMGGVTIGDGAVVGTKSLVNKDIPPYTVYAGIPARYIKTRFTEIEIQTLQTIQWWTWADNEVRDAIDLLMSSDINGLYTFWVQRIKK